MPSAGWRFCLGLLLAACAAPRGTLVLDPEAAAVGTVYPILVATSRAPTEGPELFRERGPDTVSFLRFDVSVPPDRQPGEIAYPETDPPDPRTDFVTVAAQRLDGERGFVGAVNAEAASRREHEAILFLHGYNMNFTEGLYREAQLKHDFANPNLVSTTPGHRRPARATTSMTWRVRSSRGTASRQPSPR